MRTVTWRTLRARVARFALALVAVTMGVAFVCATFTLRGMLSDTFGSMSATVPADSYVRAMAGPGGDRGVVPLTLVDDLDGVEGVTQVRPSIIGPLILVGRDGKAVAVRGGSSQRPGDQGTPASSYGLAVSPGDAGMRLVAGAFPADASQIVLERGTAERSGLTVADTTRILAGGMTHVVQVAGIAEMEGFADGATLVGLDPTTAEKLFASSGLVSQILVTTQPGADIGAVRARLTEAVSASRTVVPGTVEVVDARVVRDEAAAELDESMGAYSQALTALAAGSVLVGMFIIANTFAMVVRQQSEQTAVLRAIGASRRQVLCSVLAQATLIGTAGSVLGTVAGLGLVAAMRALLSRMDLELTGPIPLRWATVVTCLVVGVVVSLLSALVPARRAANTEPIAALREASDTPKRSRAGALAGLVALMLGVAATAVALRGGGNGQGALVVGVLLTPLGALLLAPSVLPAVLRTLAVPVAALGGVAGTLAGRNAVRSPRRSAATAAALMLGMVLVGVVCVFIASTCASLRTGLENELQADVVVQSVQGGVPEALAEAIVDTPGAARVDRLRYANLEAGGTTTAVGSLSEGAWQHSVLVPVVSGDLAALAEGQIAVQETLAEERGWSLGDRVELIDPRSQTMNPGLVLTIGAIFDSGSLGSNILVGDATYDALVPEQLRATGTVFVTSPVNGAAALRTELAELATPYPGVTVQDKAVYIASILEAVEQVQAIFYAVLAIALLVALAAITNLISLSVSERTREIGMLRAAGVERGQIAAMVLTESALVTLFGAAAGLAVGVWISTPLAIVFKAMGLRVLALPWGQLGLIFALAVLAGLIAAVLPARRAARLPVLQAITTR